MKKKNVRTVIGEVRFVNPSVFETFATTNRYYVTFVFPKNDVELLRQVRDSIGEAYRLYEGEAPDSEWEGPLRDGDKCLRRDGKPLATFRGCYYIVASTFNKPFVCDTDRNMIENDSGFYNGDYGYACVTFEGYSDKEGTDVRCEMEILMKTRSGQPVYRQTKTEVKPISERYKGL